MGMCIICGRETHNLYDYYSADASGTAERHSNAIVYKTRYSNFEMHHEFLCTKCAVSPINWFLMIFGSVIPPLFSLIAGIILARSFYSDAISKILTCLLVGVPIIFFLLSLSKLIYTINAISTDKRYEKKWYWIIGTTSAGFQLQGDAIARLMVYHKAKFPVKECIRPNEYEKMHKYYQ